MKVQLFAPPWGAPGMTAEGQEAVKILGNNVWADASTRFYAERDAKLRMGKRASKGMQATLNKLLVEKFEDEGWYADSGYFVKEDTWVRVTFRHQMSLGSDIVDAPNCSEIGRETKYWNRGKSMARRSTSSSSVRHSAGAQMRLQ